MLPGPVFNVELVTTARRPRYYLLRFIYGMALLYAIWSNRPWTVIYATNPQGFSISELAMLGQVIFMTFGTVQSITVFLVTPALVAGVIADEKRRKTLHYLLASRLSSAEIVIGKLAARLLLVGVFLAIGLPILSLTSLFGGIDPTYVLVFYAATVTTAFFLASIAIAISTFARRPREAISLTYMVSLFWLIVPWLVSTVVPSAGGWWRAAYEWIGPVNEWVLATSPIAMLSTLGMGGGGRGIAETIEWMCGLQLLYGAILVFIAIVRLRPNARNDGERGTSRVAQFRYARRILGRPECGDDAMFWKERYVSRTSFATKILGILVGLVVVAVLAYSAFELAALAFAELWNNGFPGQGAAQSARRDFNMYIRVVGTILYVLWSLGIASAASSAITSESEEDTWISLIATPLSGLEILRAKVFSAIWSGRWLGVLLGCLALTGVLTGAVHPLGFLAVLVELPICLAFVSVLGIYLSLRSKTSSQALIKTLAVLIIMNGGYLMCVAPIFHSNSAFPFLAAGVTPMIIGGSFFSSPDFGLLTNWNDSFVRDVVSPVVTGVMSIFGYALATCVLAFASLRRFETVAGRPTRDQAHSFWQFPKWRSRGKTKKRADRECD